MPRFRSELLQFCTFKCQLKSVTKNASVTRKFADCALLAHKALKRASAFFRLYCLTFDDVPEVNESTMKQCLNQVCIRESHGAKPRDSELTVKFERFWKECFCRIHPDRLDMSGKNRLKVAVAEDMCNAILVDCKTHFRARFFRLVLHLLGEGGDKREATRETRAALSGE